MTAAPDRPLPVCLAWSGGKDSALTLAALRDDDRHRVVGLVTAVTTTYDRVSIHGIRRSILHAQAEAVGLPLFEARLEPQPSNEAYERAWALALEAVRAQLGPICLVAYGDLFLEDVHAYRDAQLKSLGWEGLYPLWGRDTRELARHAIRSGLEAYLTCVDTTQLDPGFAGRRYDLELLNELPPGVDPCGEHGEFHTCVVAGPVLSHAIPVTVGRRVRRDERFEFCDLRLAADPDSLVSRGPMG